MSTGNLNPDVNSSYCEAEKTENLYAANMQFYKSLCTSNIFMDSVGQNIDLPQTGNNSLKTVATVLSAYILTIIGAFAAAKSGVTARK